MTTDDLPLGLPAATPRPSPLLLTRRLCPVVLALASTSAWAQAQTQTQPPIAPPEAAHVAQTTLAEVPALPAAVVATPDSEPAAHEAPKEKQPAKPATPSFRQKAAEAATATLTALLPRLAASDSLPLLDRSTMVAGDLSRLLADYDLSQSGVIKDDGGKIKALLKRALTLMGTPYRWGGTSPDSGFDCSGLVGYVFRTALGIELPRVSRDMAAEAEGRLIANREELKQGDLVFFGLKGRINHVGIYVGEGRFLHSPSTGKDVRVDTLMSGYWAPRFMQARRVAM